MSDPGKAVFLSYASQDAEAAKKICDALRAAGVEVWFDQSELVGGDAWDGKIRKQIKDCALLIPVISANTQQRTEGYFRLEWRLADQRTHLMAKGRAFLLPVVIDDTRDADAHVPDSFTEVQWTRLVGGDTPPKFAEQVKKLVGGETEDRGRKMEDRTRNQEPRTNNRRLGRRWWAWPIFGVVVALVLVVKESRREPGTPVPTAAAAVPAPSEPQKLLTQARAIVWTEQLDELTREDLALAESLLQRAVQLDPLSGEAWTLLALCSCEHISLRYDVTQARKGAARDQATRALRLAPDSNEARFAWAMSYRFQDSSDAKESVRLHREVAAREPTNKYILRQTGRALESTYDPANLAEALTYYERAAALPGGDALALRLQADSLFWGLGRYEETLVLIDRALALRPQAGHLYAHKAAYLMALRADLGEARAVLARMPPGFLLDDFGAMVASSCWMWSREPDKALAVLAGLSHDYIDCRWYTGPKALLTGDAHQLAGRPEAARADWRIALQQVEQKLKDEPGAALWMRHRAELLAKLGERDAAEKARQVYEQVLRLPAGRATSRSWPLYLALGRTEQVIEFLSGPVNGRDSAADHLGILRHEPALDPIRGDPRFISLLKKVEASVTGSTAAVLPVGDDKSVAVLAFANLSDDKANEYFSDGISEELLNVLAKIPGLKVSARTSAFYFKDKEVPVPEIAKQLGVAYVVEGSVRKQGDKVRITAQLIKAADGFHVWSDTFTRDLKDIFAVQDEIAGLIAQNLQLKIGLKARGEVKPEVAQLYLQGRYHLNQFTADSARRAVESLQQAVKLDPGFAPAWAAMSRAAAILGGYGETADTVREGYGLARRASQRAIELDPSLPAAHLALAEVQAAFDFDWAAATASLRRAQALAPDDAMVLQSAARHEYGAGRAARAAELAARAVASDPVNPIIRVDYAYALLALKRFEEARAQFRKIVELSPTAPWGHAGVSVTYAIEGDFERAAAEAPLEQNEWSRLFARAIANRRPGESDEAMAQLTRVYADVAAYQVAEIHAFRGDKDRAFEWLERAYRQRDPGLGWVRSDGLMDNLRSDPRWDVLLRKLRLADDQLP